MNEGQSSQILTCIVDGMRSDRPPAIRGAAARALINSLDFTRSNFEVQQERDVIMQVSPSVRLSVRQCACGFTFFLRGGLRGMIISVIRGTFLLV